MRRLAAVTFAMSLFLAAFAQGVQTGPTLKIGDSAPPLTAARWLRGNAISSYEPHTVYVIVFWATWCPAFLGAMDHLSELQAEYSTQVKVEAISVYEHNPSDAVGYSNHFANQMNFDVAMDAAPDNDAQGLHGAMILSWLEPSQQRGLPIAFIVDHTGKIAWIGSPVGESMNDPLRKIIDGSWDTSAYAQKFASEQEKAAAMNSLQTQMSTAINNSDWDKALQLSDQMTPYDPRSAAAARYLTMLRKGDFAPAYAFCKQTAEGPFAKDALGVYSLAWLTANPTAHWAKTDYGLGLELAKKAVDLTYSKNVDMLDLLAWAYHENKDKDDAVATEQLALSIANDDKKGGLERNLRTFEGTDKP